MRPDPFDDDLFDNPKAGMRWRDLSGVMSVVFALAGTIFAGGHQSDELKQVAAGAWKKCRNEMTAGQRRVGNMIEVPICAPTVVTDREGHRYAIAFADSLPVGDGNVRLIPPGQVAANHRLIATATTSDDYMRAEHWTPIPFKSFQSETFRSRLENQEIGGINLVGLTRFVDGMVTPSSWSFSNFVNKFGGVFVVTEVHNNTFSLGAFRPTGGRPQPVQVIER